ncbi:type VI secretion system baseplate subunit TssG [Salmonella enterica subsp. enterica]|uniref:Type VI secretion system baseplate subunit TssG n=1 Tax=Salmonella newport TaxID=108619 RepID=A0A5Y0RXP7_SALNE|nr:type VI secretion system baseplate subunit TssG [Salmonella enterica]EBS2908551.1 type VI secretion system baseplate subunit TssG [Salmonella enterica subsp. enterica serovar Flottbek]EBS4086100.1 type VI secretion system baseplate subunit TssG [Salmonella enterica subsp. enterica serovar Newport]ECC9721153.1 type VI secretion system baseplate subunit TssG [Salmonella enterica subsp. diarizonae]EDP8833878.1 type VI secretion system baseplate subunit TssG [Salmonella enterica subsp. enterica]
MAVKDVVSKFNYYQQVRLLLRKLRRSHSSDAILLNEKFQITSTLSLDSPNGQVESIYQNENDTTIHMVVSHNGLTGTMGALPVAYSEWMIERYYRYSDCSAKAFISIFDHRLYCLDYLTWQKHYPCALFESQAKQPTETALLAINGMLTNNSPKQFIYASLFTLSVRSVVNLECWLEAMYGISAKVIPFTGGWRYVKKDECCQLGNPQQKLSTAPMIGSVRIETQSHFDVILGPVFQKESYIFFQQRSLLEEIWENIRYYVGPALDFTIYLSINSTGFTSPPLGKHLLGRDLYIGSPSHSKQYLVKLPAPKI